LAFRYCEEVCQNYDVDGLELDFFRHALFFKCSGAGEPCGETELSQMTGLLRRIRNMAEELGRKRGRPILLAIRVPDSIEYCKWIGLDLEGWLASNLVDILVVGGYTQLNPWTYSVALGHKYGVKVYPSLDEPRIRDEAARALRSTPETYRGRALNAWHAGADGVYLFNFFDPLSPLWRELGDPALLRSKDRNYFASVRGVGSMPIPHQKFIRVPTLNPGNPVLLASPASRGDGAEPSAKSSTGARIEFLVGEDLRQGAAKPRLTLHLRFKNSVPALQAALNNTGLADGVTKGEWLEFPLSTLNPGTNTLVLQHLSSTKQNLSLLDLHVSVAVLH
jgi:hypothetical protein